MYGDTVGVAGTLGFLFLLGVIVLVWIGPAVLTWWLASERGRDGTAWFLVALFLGPLALLAVGLSPVTSALACTECREPVREGARVCPHCHTRFGQAASGDGRSWSAVSTTTAPSPARAPSTEAVLLPSDPARPPAATLGHAVLAKVWRDGPAGAPLGQWTVVATTNPMLDAGMIVTFRDERGALGIYTSDGSKRDLLIDGEYRLAISDSAPGELLIERPRGRPSAHLRQ